MSRTTEYVIQTDVKFGPLELVDVGELEQACTIDWFNQTLCEVNQGHTSGFEGRRPERPGSMAVGETEPQSCSSLACRIRS